MADVFYKDGSRVPEDKIGEALERGEAFAPKSAEVNMVDTDGVPMRIKGEDVGSALAAGYGFEGAATVEARQRRRERTTGGQLALTAGEGLARGATLGLSDVASTALLGDEYRQGALERQQENRLVSGASEFVGSAAGALATGGVGGVLGAPARGAAALGRATEGAIAARLGTGIGARALAMGGAGAVEGAAYGAGSALSKAALEGRELSAEKVLMSMGEGAVLGGVASGVLGAAAKAVSGARAPGGKSFRAGARQLADESALKALGARGDDLRRLVGRRTGEAADKRLSEVAQDLLSYELKSGPKAGQKIFRAAAKAEDLADDVVRARGELGEQIGAVRSQIDSAMQADHTLAPDVGRYLKQVDDEVIAPLRKSASPTVRAKADKVADELAGLRERHLQATGAGGAANQVAPPMTFAELDQFRRDLRSVFQPPRPASGGLPAPPPEHAEFLEKAERMLASHLDDAAENALGKMGQDAGAYRELKRQYSNFRDLEDIVTKAELQQLGNRAVSPSDYATGLGAGLGALMSGNIAALGVGAASTIAHKLVRERGRSVLAVLADNVARGDSVLGDAAKRFAGTFSGSPKRLVTPATMTGAELTKHYLAASSAVKDFERDADHRLTAATFDFAPEYPTLAAGVQQQIARANGFLASKMPTPLGRKRWSVTPDLEAERVPATEQAKFMRYVRGVTRPAEVLEDLSQGRLDREGLEAVKHVFPETFNELRAQVMTEVQERDAPLPFSQRMMLSIVFDFEGDRSLEPGYAQRVQQSFEPQPEAPPEESGHGPPPQLSPSLANSMQTETQRVSGGI